MTKVIDMNEQAQIVEGFTGKQLYVNGTLIAHEENGKVIVPFEQSDEVMEHVRSFEAKVHGQTIGTKLFG